MEVEGCGCTEALQYDGLRPSMAPVRMPIVQEAKLGPGLGLARPWYYIHVHYVTSPQSDFRPAGMVPCREAPRNARRVARRCGFFSVSGPEPAVFRIRGR